eukprot:INCI9993.1.p1 GENE.INCI9993.1~~INCI9993.1.p1  ORF type:complete len:429 (+),score=61.57 INCI9993.1:818-2104(+)
MNVVDWRTDAEAEPAERPHFAEGCERCRSFGGKRFCYARITPPQGARLTASGDLGVATQPIPHVEKPRHEELDLDPWGLNWLVPPELVELLSGQELHQTPPTFRELAKMNDPSKAIRWARADAFNVVRATIHSKFPEATCFGAGSFDRETDLPGGLSDVDMHVRFAKNESRKKFLKAHRPRMQKLRQYFESLSEAKSLRLSTSAATGASSVPDCCIKLKLQRHGAHDSAPAISIDVLLKAPPMQPREFLHVKHWKQRRMLQTAASQYQKQFVEQFARHGHWTPYRWIVRTVKQSLRCSIKRNEWKRTTKNTGGAPRSYLVELIVAYVMLPINTRPVAHIIADALRLFAEHSFTITRLREKDCTDKEAIEGVNMSGRPPPTIYCMSVGNPTQNCADYFFGPKEQLKERLLQASASLAELPVDAAAPEPL